MVLGQLFLSTVRLLTVFLLALPFDVAFAADRSSNSDGSNSGIATGEPAKQVGLCQIADEALVVASGIRGLSIKAPVQCEVNDREQVLVFLEGELRRQSLSVKLEAESLLYKTLGLLPREFDYEKGLLELYSAQLGGYYDPHRRRYVLASWLGAAFQRGVAVHELTHALQDQHFNLEAFLPPARYSSDETMARQALAEGDASAVMLDDLARRHGEPVLAERKDLTAYLFQQLISSMFTAAIYSSPASLQATLIFPYMSGVLFVQQLLQQGGYAAVDRAYSAPPQTTAEILDPALFCNSSQCRPFRPADVPTALQFWRDKIAGYREVFNDRIGQFVCGVIAGGGQLGRGGCGGWRGDRFSLLKMNKQHPNGDSRALSVIVSFADPEAAKGFADRIQLALSGRNSAGEFWVSRRGLLVGFLVLIKNSSLA